MPDLPGYGESDPSPTRSAAEAASAVGDLADELRLRQIDLFGVHYGAMVALDLAATRPLLVRRLVLADVPGGERRPSVQQQRLIVDGALLAADQTGAAPLALASQISAFLA